MVAKKFQLTREACDALAVQSHERAAKARDAGLFDSQIMPIKVCGTC
jgi:acetyl-CoA C-acetyltransferase